uniref:Uncharacterized protein B12J7.010 n=1 Tax=Neurospora crassa TaxID=5141 RepID=Q6MV05_NEUCS|nr:hypothetical protein [Neurospora crassa]
MHNKRDGKVAVGAETDRHKGKITRSTAKQKLGRRMDSWMLEIERFGNVALTAPGWRGVGCHGCAKIVDNLDIPIHQEPTWHETAETTLRGNRDRDWPICSSTSLASHQFLAVGLRRTRNRHGRPRATPVEGRILNAMPIDKPIIGKLPIEVPEPCASCGKE